MNLKKQLPDITILKKLCKESYSFIEFAKKIGYKKTSSNIKKIIEEYQLDDSNFGNWRLKTRTRKRTTKICPICGTDFLCITLKSKKEQVTCSIGCSNTYFRTGKNHANFKGNNYRTICWSNHKKECLICGENKIVAVHHYDHDHNNNEPENLVPLCPTHHQYWHSRFRNLIKKKVDDYVNNFKLKIKLVLTN